MDARERWQALQARLKSARAAFEAGDRETALAEITAALDLDAEYLAAQALRDRILEMSDAALRAPHPAPCDAASHVAPSDPPAGYAKFEQRARRRRVDRKVDAARVAIAQQRLKAAAVALDEVIDLDPNLPELAALTAQFDELRRSVATPRHGAWLTAAAVFAAALLGGSWLQDSTPLLSRQIVSAAPLPALPSAVPVARPRADMVGTTGVREADTVTPDSAAAAVAPEDRVTISPIVRPVGDAIELAPPAPRVADAGAVSPDLTTTIVPVSTTISSRLEVKEDDEQIKQALQRYRSANEGLDAQSLTFDACDVRQYGESATATCQGSARYLPKAGSREPRVEPRVWSFTLRKSGNDWKIDSARAER